MTKTLEFPKILKYTKNFSNFQALVFAHKVLNNPNI